MAGYLTIEQIRELAIEAWHVLWKTHIGLGRAKVKLSEIDAPATVVGYFFEKLFAKLLQAATDGSWRGGRTKDEKDLVCETDTKFSTEIKTSGQLGLKVFGNRSYGQKPKQDELVSKIEKSGYYITVNFYKQSLNLIRFGWIDFDDWRPQGAQTGQAATLPDVVYSHKLIEIPGDYLLAAPVSLLEGVGPATASLCAANGIYTIRDVIDYVGDNAAVLRLKEKAQRYARVKGSE